MTDETPSPTLPATLSLRAIFEPEADGWIHARLVGLPGVITSARTAEEARAMLGDALREYLLSLEDESTAGDARAVTESLILTIM